MTPYEKQRKTRKSLMAVATTAAASATACRAGVSSLGMPGVPWHPQILADQLTLSQPEGADYAHQIVLAPPDFQTLRRPYGWDSIFSHIYLL